MNHQQQLITQRAIAMAYVRLAERSDLNVREAIDGDGRYDLFHYVVRLPDKKRGLRQFAVESVGELEVGNQQAANQLLAEKVQVVAKIGPYPFPTLLFLFSMKDDSGWYTWVSEPRIANDEEAELVLRKKPDCQPLTQSALDTIVSRVDQWYDSFYTSRARTVPK
jgi:hypothetical protein